MLNARPERWDSGTLFSHLSENTEETVLACLGDDLFSLRSENTEGIAMVCHDLFSPLKENATDDMGIGRCSIFCLCDRRMRTRWDVIIVIIRL